MIMLFCDHRCRTPVWLIVMMAFTYGFLTSLQYTSMNTLAYADVGEREASSASTIASTVQQMAVSFGVATASLAAALFIPDRLHATRAANDPRRSIWRCSGSAHADHRFHQRILAICRRSDGAAVSRHKPNFRR